MTELLIFLSKYIFIVLFAVFCLQSRFLLSGESPKAAAASGLQRFIIVLFHILGFSALNFNSEIPLEDFLMAALGGLALITLVPPLFELVYGKKTRLIINCAFLLMDTGLIILQRLNPTFAMRQLIFFAMGSVLVLFIHPILKTAKKLWRLKYVYLGLSLLLLFVTLILGTSTRGATNWIHIGEFSFQPSEIVKVLYVFYFASVFCRKTSFGETVLHMLVGACFVVLLVFQRDLGSALIFFMTLLIMVYISTGNIVCVGGSLMAAALGSVIAYYLFGHIRVRVSAWLDPWSDIGDTTYQIAQSLFAIGSGSLWGSGLGKGYASAIPIVETDFVFSAICEEFGIIFAVLLIFVYMLMFCCGIKAALGTESKFEAVLTSGLTGLLCFQTFLIIGGVTKFIPMTGVTLPFISYGGTSAVISTVIVGLLMFYLAVSGEDRDEKYGPDDIVPRRRKAPPRRTSGSAVGTKTGRVAAATDRPLRNRTGKRRDGSDE